MHARVSTYRGDGDRLIEGFEGVSDALTAVGATDEAIAAVGGCADAGQSL